MRNGSILWRVTLLALAALTALIAPASAAAADSPSVRLIAADRSIQVTQRESMNPGLWIAASGGDFVIRAQRPGYKRWQAAQIDSSTGATLREIPPQLFDPARGLRRFLEVRFRDRRGRMAARRILDLCPASAERVSPDGPRNPAYSGHCDVGFPFVRGTVWGIDRGWAGPAVDPFSSFELPMRLEPGRYDMRASIRGPYRRLFDLTPDAATARARVRVIRHARRERRSRADRSGAAGATSGARTRAAVDGPPPDPATLPDLVALPPWQMDTRSRRGRDLLHFAGSPWNAGPGPLVVEGYRGRGRDRMEAVQSFLDREGEVASTAPAGEMAFHGARGHDHWHFLQLVTYRIVRPSAREVVRGVKQSFCLANTDAVDLTLPGADLAPDIMGLGSACGDSGSIWIRQMLSAGWADTYDPSLPGQRMDITGVPNGRYLLEMRVNPEGQLQETTASNNVARLAFVLGGKPGRRIVRVRPWRGIRD